MSELREALNAAGASALVPKIIDPILLEYQRRYSPLVRSIPTVPWAADTYYFNQRTSVAAGGFVPDGGARPVANSAYLQAKFDMKHVQVVGAVTGYAQQVTRQVIGDLRETEIEGSIRGLYWDIETGMCWGNAASTATGAQPQFDGLDTQIATFTGGFQNAQDKAGASLTLPMLDELIDMVETNAAMPVFDDTWQIVLSNTAASKIAQLQQSSQRYVDTVEVAAGLIVPTYRNIPLVKTSFLQARGYSVGTVATATATTGGSLPASSTYKYVISAVVARQGEIGASAEVSQATGSGTSTNTITLSFSSPAGLDGLQPQLYKVYRTLAGGATGTETFLGYVDGTVGLAADGVTPILTTSIVDTGTALVPQNSSTVPATLPVQYYGTNANLLPPSTGQENIYLISRDRNNVVRPYVREAEPLDVYPTTASPDTLPYAVISDTTLAVRAPRFTGRLARVGVSV
ncbi:SU10 major capsid protein [Streptantibioticus silvisoli]|uniref:Phage major capsid protein n=1 Tax=Streptantibioticus silvisoli TaxID=2705255 RepID=A0ABT6W4X6_9ACTN|nr:hypothetical protein [Streptantibioticus silvisoli]MDI5965724.1 hypothetical protein [Streptantibioticus silvisoli]